MKLRTPRINTSGNTSLSIFLFFTLILASSVAIKATTIPTIKSTNKIDYETLGFSPSQLFACTRIALNLSWVTDYDKKICDEVKTTALIKYCSDERELDWQVYCKSLNDQGFGIDCNNSNPSEVSIIKNKLAMSSGSRQFGCLNGK